MKYLLLVSLLTSAVYAAPFAQVQGRATAGQTTEAQGANTNGQATQQQGQQAAQPPAQQQQQQGNEPAQNANQPAVNAPPTGTGAGIANGQTPSTQDLANAVANWMADTGIVSNFLNTGKSITNNVQFKQAALVALNAENDELVHKAVIDAANGNMPNVIGANSTLATAGSFQDVVDRLQAMSTQGVAAVDNIDLINQNRCVNGILNGSCGKVLMTDA